MAKRYTEEKRTYIVALYQNGSTVPELCAKYGLSRSSLYGWIRQHSGGPAKTKSAREIYLLVKEIERLRITNEILINCGCSIIAPLQEKLPAIERLKGHYSIHALCGTLGVNRATFTTTCFADQGAQYMAYEFRALLRKYKVTQSFSKPGMPFDNAVAESFFASVKKECSGAVFTIRKRSYKQPCMST